MPTRRLARRTLAVLAFALAFAAPAAATPGVITLGPGLNPAVAVDENGTAHFVWDDRGGGARELRYCRIPAGASACDISRLLETPSEPNDDDSSPPLIFTREPGEVIVISRRCCNSVSGTSSSQTSVFDSTDGGTTFTGPRPASSAHTSGNGVLGPGAFSFSSVTDGDSGGTQYQAAPIDEGFETATANLSIDATHEATVGMVDAQTPIVAMTTLTDLYYRVFGGGNPNDASDWKPIVGLGPGGDPHLASGPRGTFLMNLTGGSDRKYVLRKFDTAAQSFAPPIDVTGRVDPVFGQLHEDGGGNLHAIWRGPDDTLEYRSSIDGATFTPKRTIADVGDGDIVGMTVGAGADGKGWAVWEDGVGGVSGPLRAVRVDAGAGAGGPGGPACANNIKFGVAVAFAVSGCFTTSDRNVYTATGPVRVNGVDLRPAPGDDVKTRINRQKATLTTSGPVVVAVDRVILDRKRIDWDLPKAGAATVDTFMAGGDIQSGLLGFPVSGEADLHFLKGGRAELPANLKLPDFWDGTTAKTVLKASNAGIDLRKVNVDIPKFNLSLLGIDAFDIEYEGDNPFTFIGKAQFKLPPSSWELTAGFRLEDGELAEASLKAIFDPALPIVGVVGLKGIGALVHARPKPAFIEGQADVVGGPTVAGQAAVEVDGKLRYTFPDPGPALIEVNAALLIVGIKLGTGAIRYASNGVFSIAAALEWTVAGIGVKGGLDGFVDIPRAKFQIGANAEVCYAIKCSGGEFVASTKGIGTCAGLPLIPLGPDLPVGIVWHYDDVPEPMLGECSVSSVSEDKPVGGLRAAQAEAGRDVTLDAGHPSALIMVDGRDAAPRLRVTAPGGAAIESSGDAPLMGAHAGKLTIISSPEAKRTFVRIDDAAAGTYRLDTLDGSEPIAKVSHGYEPPPVKIISARVSGHGRKRALRYRISGLGGPNRVTFSEMGVRGGGGSPAAGAIIGTAKRGHGRIAFRPGPGPGGKRRIVALVEQAGIPTSDDAVASYVAPPPLKPSRPTHVRARLSGRKLKVSWGHARAARLYRVRVALRRDGRVVQVQTKRRSLALKGVDRPDSAKIEVFALRPVEGTRSGAAKARVRLARKKSRH